MRIRHFLDPRTSSLTYATRVFTLHDYQPGGRDLWFESTIGEQKRTNVHLNADTTKEEFVALRRRLEEGKPAPTLLFPSLQVNIRGGLFLNCVRITGIAARP